MTATPIFALRTDVSMTNISFDNTQNAFAYKTDKELKQSRFLFNTMDYPLFVPIGTRLTPFLMKTGLPVNGIIRNTIFKQFVGGETLAETATVSVPSQSGELSAIVVIFPTWLSNTQLPPSAAAPVAPSRSSRGIRMITP